MVGVVRTVYFENGWPGKHLSSRVINPPKPHAAKTRSQSENHQREHPGASRRTAIRADPQKVRREDGQCPGRGHRAIPSAEARWPTKVLKPLGRVSFDEISTMNPITMSVMDAIYERRAVRSYTGGPVEAATVNALLEAAVHAPTAVHEEPCAFAVIQDRGMLQRLSDSAKKLIPNLERDVHLPGEQTHHFTLPENVFYNAGTLIVIYGRPVGAFVVADCWLAAENLMLAARGMGLGTCVIGLAVAALNTSEWKVELKVPRELTAYAPIIVGVPVGETLATGRKKPEVLVWITPT